MKSGGILAISALATAIAAPMLISSPTVLQDGFTLADATPNDVFMYVLARKNPEREFLDQYWSEVFEALEQSGVGGDVIELLGSVLNAEQTAEMERLKERASQLLVGVDWQQLAGKEMVFAERFDPPKGLSGDKPPIIMADMVWIFRGSGEGAAHNYQGLTAILQALVDEINKVVGAEALVVERSTSNGAEVASVNLLRAVTGMDALPLAVALRGDVIVIGLREGLFNDVLALMDGSSAKTALAGDPRFKAAFAQLPPAEDTMTFFDMQAFLNPLRKFLGSVIKVVEGPDDIYINSGLNSEANQINRRAVSAYQNGDVEKALELVQQAHEADPKNSIVLFNLACFNALLGNRDVALDWLEKSVEGGFYAPRKIANDSDLVSLRDDARFKAALVRAGELARESKVKDTIINSSKTGEAYRLGMQAIQAYHEKDYEQALKLAEQAHAVAPKDSRVLYGLACFHALLGHENEALDFLDEAVDGGFYCPAHISKDPDLDSVREDERYKAAAARARKNAAEYAMTRESGKAGVAKRLIDRFADAVGILDYAATVETTDGYTTCMESVTVLVSDAKERPIYPVLGHADQITHFDKYLPQETVSFSISGGFSFGELYKFLEDSVRVAGPDGEDLLKKWDEVQQMIGVNIQEDVIGWIGEEFITVTMADQGGSVWLVKVTDEDVAREKVGAAIDFLSTQLTQVISKQPALAGLAMLGVQSSPADDPRLEGFQELRFTMSPQPAVWGVTDGYLIFGSSADAAALCMATAAGKHPSIRENARVMSEALVPDGPFTALTLVDRRNLGKELEQGAGIASMVVSMMGAFIPEPEARPVLAKIARILGKLGPVARKIDFYKSVATQTTFDGQAYRYKAVTHYFSPEERAASNAP